MALSYNAFISYRHHPDDIRVAGEIHRSLERFHIPGPLKKKTKKISRLFRDKEELPITSNLNDDIRIALENSDFLIVICSVHTKESGWVQREIELFLETHDRDHVLTVLASGEPYDVIPECLLYEDVTDPDTGETKRIEYEPLSCDWRMPRRKAQREELPRLAAAILGCAYDELRQRQKQYRTRRLTAILAAAFTLLVGLSAYFMYSAITIQKHLEASQKSQSQHLASAAGELLNEGDRLTAISLAMAALPSPDNDRPYVPSAEFVLTSALDLYNADCSGFSAAGIISPGEGITIRDFVVSPDRKYLYIWDERHVLTCWDTQTFGMLSSITPKEGLSMEVYAAQDGIIVYSIEQVTCYAPDGSSLWTIEGFYDAALCTDQRTLLLLDLSGKLLFIDTATGKETRAPIEIPCDSEASPLSTDLLGFPSRNCSADLPIAIACRVKEVDPSTGLIASTHCDILTVDPKSGTVTTIPVGAEDLHMVTVTPDRKLLVTSDPETEALMIGVFEGNRINGHSFYKLLCYDIDTQAHLWSGTVSSDTFSGFNSLTPIPGSNRVLCQVGLSMYVFDTGSGELVSQCAAGSGVVAISVEETKTWAILQDGYIASFVYDQHYCFEQKCMAGPISDGALGQDYYGLQWDSNTIIVYRPRKETPAWEYKSEHDIGGMDSLYIRGNLIAFENSGKVHVFDLQTKQPLPGFPLEGLQLLDFSDDGTRLVCADGEGALAQVDIATAEVQTTSLPIKDYASPPRDFALRGNILSYLIRVNDETTLFRYDTAGEQVLCSLDITTQNTAYGAMAILGQTDSHVWIWVPDGKVVEVDVAAQTETVILKELTAAPKITLLDDKVIITSLGDVHVRTPGGGELLSYSMENVTIGSVCPYGTDLLFLCDDGFLYRCDANGKLISQLQLHTDYGFASALTNTVIDPLVRWEFTQDGRLVLSACQITNVIDLETWALRCYVPKGIAYDPGSDSYLCTSAHRLMAYPACDVETLLQIAQTQLGTFQLTNAQKTAYGID